MHRPEQQRPQETKEQRTEELLKLRLEYMNAAKELEQLKSLGTLDQKTQARIESLERAKSVYSAKEADELAKLDPSYSWIDSTVFQQMIINEDEIGRATVMNRQLIENDLWPFQRNAPSRALSSVKK